jgi:hypothetical protein
LGSCICKKNTKSLFEKAINQIAFGGNDYGVDGFHFDEAKRNLYLFQFKFTPSYGQFKQSMQRLIDVGMQRIFSAPNKDDSKNQILIQLRSALIDNRNLIDQICFRFVFTGEPSDAERSKVLDKLREDLENKRYYVEQFFFPRTVNFIVEFRSSSGKVGGVIASETSAKFTLPVTQSISAQTEAGEQMLTFFVPVIELNQMYVALGTRFFDRNVRYGLGENETVNRAIAKALSQIIIDRSLDPSTFVFNHNGVTLYTESVEAEDDHIEISSPRLLNGAQTVTTFAEFLSKNRDHPKLKNAIEIIERIQVVCKIITNAADPFVTRVTINNNRQNPVEAWNLHANDMIQLELQDKFLDELQLYYERQENAFNQLSAEDLDEYGLKSDSKAIQMLKLAQTFIVTDGNLSRVSEMRRVFEEERTYELVFNASRLATNSHNILLCYKVERRLRKLAEDIRQKGQNKYYFAPKARFLIWALCCQGILNDPKLDKLRAEHGSNMVVSANFSEYLSKLATVQVAPILAALMTDDEYTDRIAEDKLGFLRTDAAFDKCMKIAFSRSKWVRKRLV